MTKYSRRKLPLVRKTSEEELTKQIRKIFKKAGFKGPFKPFAFYDEMLDVIRVVTADCSITEVRITSVLTLLERNFLEEGQGQYVGFNIEAARISAGDMGLPTCGTVKISLILNSLAKNYNKIPVAIGAIREVAIAILEDNGLDEVQFPAK